MTDSNNTQLLKKFKILLIGDDCLDTYTYGFVNRISPEAPVPIFEPTVSVTKEGMAGNVKNNLEALGCEVHYLHGDTSEKERLIDDRSKQQLIRIDRDKISVPILIDSELPKIYDAIVISDYNKGTVTYDLVKQLREDFNGPIFIDTKKTDLMQFEGCFVKINQLERSRAMTIPSNQWLIVTHGDRGTVWNGQEIPTETVQVADVTGAGDTFLASLAVKYLETKEIQKSIQYANRAAGITVQHIGVYAPTKAEIA